MSLADLAAVGLPAALVIRLAATVAALALAGHARAVRTIALGGSILASTLTMAAGAHVIGAGQAVDGLIARHAASGFVLGYSVTPLSAWFLLVLGVVAIPVALYSTAYFAHALTPPRAAVAAGGLNVLLGAVEVIFAADGFILFLGAWEVMTLATAVLVVVDHEQRANRRAAYLYLVMSHVGTAGLIAGFLILAAASGAESFGALAAVPVANQPVRQLLFVLFFIGFGVKAGLVPLHVWLPEAHPAAPSSISALMSAGLITTGIYGLVRVCAFGLGVPDSRWGLALMGIGTLSAVLGVLYALTQRDIKRLLAYSTIENAGIIVLALGIGMFAHAHGQTTLAAVAVTASLLHVLNHAVFKGLLFLGAGGLVMATGTRQIEQCGGLIRRMPWTAATFLVGALAISGLPLLNGFVSEWMTFQALLMGFASAPGLVRLNFPISGALLALTSALAATCYVRAFGISFLAMPRSPEAASVHESPRAMIAPQVGLAALCLALGLFPGVALHALARVTVSLAALPSGTDAAQGPLGVIAWSSWAAGGTGTSAATRTGAFDHLVPAVLGTALLGGLAVAGVLARAGAVRRVPSWGCGGELTPQTEYTATAFSKPLMLIFHAVYRPTRDVETLTEGSRYFPTEVRYRAQIEPTFERYLYEPLARGVWRVAAVMKGLQAGSLHAYLAYVLVLGVLYLLWLGGSL